MRELKILITLMLLLAANQLWLSAQVTIVNPENYPEPVPLTDQTSEQLGEMMPRTMYLLESSTPENRKKVKIAIYGQSLSDDNNRWWRDLDTALRSAYPYADIEVKCLAVGGFATATLWRTTYADISVYYPDLVILCVAGHHTYYESILRFIRGCTTAEVMIQNDQIKGTAGEGTDCTWDVDLNDWSDWDNKMSFHYLPEFCRKYGLELVNRKQEWRDYLKANCYTPMSGSLLLPDSSHMAIQGQYLTAALTARHFRFDPEANPDPNKMVTTYKVGTDVKLTGNTIKLPVSGNRIDIVTTDGKGKETIQLFIDGKKPSSFPGCYNNTRVFTHNSYWNGGVVQTFGTSVDLQEEKWTVDMDKNGDFTLTGSKTGNDGKGNIKERFESNSGRIVLRAEDWFKGHSELSDRNFTFYTQLHATDNYQLPASQSSIDENAVTLAQGFPNGKHELLFTGTVEKIKEIRIYRPSYQLFLDAGIETVKFETEGGMQDLTITTNTYWQVYNRTPWVKIDAVDNNTGSELREQKTIVITVAKNDTGKARKATVTLVGIGTKPLELTISQS